MSAVISEHDPLSQHEILEHELSFAAGEWRVAGPAEDVLNNRLRTGLNSDHVVESPAIRARKSIE